ncbi:MAG: hypothetical protein V4669_00110 [Pseudomonadota bacterium]
MLSPQDDLIGHQTSQPFTVSGNGHPLFTERYWYTAHPIDGTPLILDLGLGYYPNRGVMDLFAGMTVGRKQINFRASRSLGSDPLRTTAGPLRIEVVEGGKRHRLVLGENASGLSFDVTFDASFPAAREKQSVRERNGAVEEDMARFAQFGRYTGWIVADGKRYDVTPQLWWGQRDHSWGIRSEMKTDAAKPPMQEHSKFFWTWSMFQFEDMAVSMFVKEREAGKPYYLSGVEFTRAANGTVHEREIVGFEHDFHWADDPLGQTMASADLRVQFAHGPDRMLHMEGLPTRFYLKGGLYGGFGGWNHGDHKGELYLDHDVWDLDDAQTRRVARTLSDHVVRVTSGGQVGSGISEYGVAQGYARYPAPQRFPAL